MIEGDLTPEEPRNDLEEPLLPDSLPDDAAQELQAAESTLRPLGVTRTTVKRTCLGYPSLQFTAMVSNLSTSYNVVNISMVLPILQHLYQTESTEQSKALVATSLLGGMILGQVLGGALGDSPYIGRLRALQCVMALQVVASVASSFCGSTSRDHEDDDQSSKERIVKAVISLFCLSKHGGSSLYMQLALWRFLLGVGAGAVYPLAAVISAEQHQRLASGASTDATSSDDQLDALSRVVMTFSMQGIGFLAVPLAALLLLFSLSDLETIWRLLLALGSLPGLLLWVLYCTLSAEEASVSVVHEPVLTSAAAGGRPNDSTEDRNSLSEPLLQGDDPLPNGRGILNTIWSEDNLLAKLAGTAGTWFLFDVLFYGNTLFQPIVMGAAFGKPDANGAKPLEVLRQTAQDSLLLAIIALPGYFVASWMLGKRSCCRQTPRYVMLQGFACMSALYLCIGLFWERLKQSPALLILLYGLTFFFANYGPNTTTFVLPSLIYSAPCRTTLNGISAAAGKFGAFVGAALFAPIADTYGDETVMMTCSVLALVAFVITFRFVHTD